MAPAMSSRVDWAMLCTAGSPLKRCGSQPRPRSRATISTKPTCTQIMVLYRGTLCRDELHSCFVCGVHPTLQALDGGCSLVPGSLCHLLQSMGGYKQQEPWYGWLKW